MTVVHDVDGIHTDLDGHRHDDGTCFECVECGHRSCAHAEDPTAVAGLGMCETPWCRCLEAVLVDGERTKCARCGGYGEIAVEPIPRDPQQLQLRACPACDGTGDVRTEKAS